jgi:acetyl esterase/lipase
VTTTSSAREYVPDAIPSFVSRILGNALRVTVRPVMNLVPSSAIAVTAARGFTRVFLPVLAPAGPAKVRHVRTHYDGHRVIGEWVHGAKRQRRDSVILYLHGGGFVCCSPRTHRGLIAQFSGRAGVPVFAVNYRLAPKYRAPAAADDAVNAYRWLLANGYAPENIVVAGDSAGGHLAVGMGIALRAQRDPMPAGMVLFSPLVDFSVDTATELDARHRDPYLTAELAKRMLAMYGTTGDPRLELLRGDVSGLPPMLLQAGGAEMLSGDAEALAALVEAAGGRCTLQLWPGQVHVFQTLYRLVPEARAALDQAGAFVRTVLDAAPADRPALHAVS